MTCCFEDQPVEDQPFPERHRKNIPRRRLFGPDLPADQDIAIPDERPHALTVREGKGMARAQEGVPECRGVIGCHNDDPAISCNTSASMQVHASGPV
jgi:hypothetical protein